ncbi:hypothetical protein ABTX81_28650 [Kitasatospora sp. NPDC097605]|uniref:hypothetical protein n=1 Tax=Kitasatospora sp. NPDC097605 TaxID=3157226 RepID=UPI00331C1E14
MATVKKDDPGCHADIVFVGNLRLLPYTEDPDTKLPPPHATAALNIDVLAASGYENVEFEDVMVFLEIKGPPGAQFVEHDARTNWFWGNPDGSDGWVEIPKGTPTTRLRMRLAKGKLLRPGPLDGLTYYVGLSGLPADGGLDVSASASAGRVTATAVSCSIEVTDLREGETLPGYLS